MFEALTHTHARAPANATVLFVFNSFLLTLRCIRSLLSVRLSCCCQFQMKSIQFVLVRVIVQCLCACVRVCLHANHIIISTFFPYSSFSPINDSRPFFASCFSVSSRCYFSLILSFLVGWFSDISIFCILSSSFSSHCLRNYS